VDTYTVPLLSREDQGKRGFTLECGDRTLTLIERFAQLAVRRLVEVTPQPAGTPTATRDANYRVLVGHGDATDAGALLLKRVETALPKDGAVQGWVTDMGTALGVHGGPGTLIVSLVRGR